VFQHAGTARAATRELERERSGKGRRGGREEAAAGGDEEEA